MRTLADFLLEMEGEQYPFTTWVYDTQGRYEKLLISTNNNNSFNLSDYVNHHPNVVVEFQTASGHLYACLLLSEINVATFVNFDNGKIISYIENKAA